MKGDVTRANIVTIQERLMGIPLLTKGMLGKGTVVTDSTRCTDKAILCSGNNDVDHVSGDVLDGQTMYWFSEEIHFAVVLLFTSNPLLFSP
jgi:hypothetical protein